MCGLFRCRGLVVGRVPVGVVSSVYRVVSLGKGVGTY
jgi:hypothetical protein